VFNCQAVDRDDRLQRATILVDMLSRYCSDDSLSALCESLIADGQQRVVDKYLRREDVERPQSPGTHTILCQQYVT